MDTYQQNRERSERPLPRTKYCNEVLQHGNHLVPINKEYGMLRLLKGTQTFSQSRQSILTSSQQDNIWEESSNHKPDFLCRFQRVARCVIILSWLYKEHCLIANFSYGIERVKRENYQTYWTEQLKDEILFDVTLFRAKKQARERLSERAVQILRQHPQGRSKQDICYCLNMLRLVKAFGNYSSWIQKKVVKAAWYSRYESCQVMIQQGYVPHSFYICLSGSAIVIKRNKDGGQIKPSWFYSQGDAFGDLEIINGVCWGATVVIQEPAEFLCVDKEDFVRIFLYSEKKMCGDPDQLCFLRSLDCFQDWPVNLLEGDPSKCTVCHYRRGTVVLRHSRRTEWIYIVTAGSCSVLKIFKDDSPLSQRTRSRKIREAGTGFQKSVSASKEVAPVVIEIDTLKRGSVFGLLDFLFENQPNVCVVSNGAECLRILKKFYLHHASEDLVQRLRRMQYCYPSEADLKEKLQQQLQWQTFRKAAVANTIQNIKLKQYRS
ncbi:cyclic nucleotide-binding domain-containing protein 2-like [Tiliqua scincoides]|uniref:cyclic nucleotide-binding domain-containing protein 2-like n=1 Tax=Tiliqua scincoides TaxID=71010 RepID=UPI0034619CEC